MGSDTIPNLFIVESLGFDDEDAQRFEGQILRQILSLSERQSTYFYIRTRRELEKIAANFGRSAFRYLHLSCHGNSTGMATTLDSLTFQELGEILRPHLSGRRVFLSACEMATKELARELLDGSGCFSVIGPRNEVAFGDAAILWSSFYHLMFRNDDVAMKRKWIKSHLQSAVNLFGVPMNYYSKTSPGKPVSLTTVTPSVPR